MKSILLVEDDQLLQNMMRDYFLYKKFKVLTASNSIEARHLLNTHHFDVAITDMQLEERNSGIVILEHIVENHLNVIPIICTGHHEDIAKIKEKAAFYYLKPIDLDNILFDISKELLKAKNHRVKN